MSNEQRAERENRIIQIPPNLLHPHPKNAEIYGEEDVDMALVESIREGGILEEIQVTPEYTIISGHRRCNAALYLGLDTVPVRMRYDLDTIDKIEWALVEANRTQRRKSREQQVREIQVINEKIVKFRRELKHTGLAEDVQDIGTISDQELARIRQDCNVQEMRDLIAKNIPGGNKGQGSVRSLHIALKYSGMSERSYAIAREAMLAIEKLECDGQPEKADELRKVLNTKGIETIKAAVNRVKGKPGKKKPQPSAKLSDAIRIFSNVLENLPVGDENLARGKIALGIMRALQNSLHPKLKTERIQHGDAIDNQSECTGGDNQVVSRNEGLPVEEKEGGDSQV